MIPVIDEDISLLAAEKRRIEGEIMPLMAEETAAKRQLGKAHENLALLETSMPFLISASGR
jgi:hypothetical protein